MISLSSLKIRGLGVLLFAGLGLLLADASTQQGKDKKPAPEQQGVEALPPNVVRSLNWRSIGPANMAGRVTALAVYEADPTCYYVASASGGLLKTTNNGMTFEHQFDHESTVSIGDVCVAPSDRNIVWVGTGEANPRNSVSYGDGVYKSIDGGKSWRNMGLKETFQIGKILIHPTNPDIVYVGALGRCYGYNKDRGVYKTTDGGKTWTQILFKDDKTGVIDMVMHPSDPNTILVALFERKRDGHDSYLGKNLPAPYDRYDPINRFGEHAGIYKTTDGGKSFAKASDGLPVCKMGRIGLDWCKGSPNVCYAVVDCEDIGKGPAPKKDEPKKDDPMKDFQKKGGGKGASKDRPFGEGLGGQAINADQGPDGWKYGGVYRSDDAGKTWKRVNSLNPRPMYFSVVRVDPSNDQFVYLLGVSQYKSTDGGKTFTPDAGKGVHSDAHALWINPKDGRHMLIGVDGGWYVSYDRATTWDHLNTMAMGQFYHVAMCNKKPYWVYGGLQDNGSWGLPSVGLKGRGPVNEEVISIGGGDGFVCRVDPNDNDLIYFESQDGNMSRRNLRTGEKASLRPGGGKGGGGPAYRWNWNTPMILSNFNSKIFYCAGDVVFKSLDRGDDLKPISPEITLTKLGSGTALSESPKNADVLWAGTDDGGLWITRDGGRNWKEVSGKVGTPGPRWVSTIEASRFKEGRCYVCFDAHRSDDDKPYIFVTEDFGETWASLQNNIPGFGSTRCLREDIENEDLLFCGTEFHIYASINRGKNWAKINNNLPTVAVHEVAIHPTAGEICVATHGRSLWIMDVTALRQMKPSVLAEPAHLFKPNTTINWQTLVSTGGTNRKFVGTNPPSGAQIYYHLAKEAKNVAFTIIDVSGKTAGTFNGPTKKGLNIASWGGGGGGGKKGFGGGDFPGGKLDPDQLKQLQDKFGKAGKGKLDPDQQKQKELKQLKDQPGKGGLGGGGFGGGFGGGPPPGVYRVVMNVDGQEFSSTLRVEADPNVPARPAGGLVEDAGIGGGLKR